MNSITSGPPAHHHDRIAAAGLFADLVARSQSHAPAENQRISEVFVVEIDNAVDRGNPHAISIIAHSGHDLLQNALGVNDAFGERVQGSGFRVQCRVLS